jgi:hypothetical protein
VGVWGKLNLWWRDGGGFGGLGSSSIGKKLGRKTSDVPLAESCGHDRNIGISHGVDAA